MAGLYTLLLLVTCALSVVMLLVLFALRRANNPGVRLWFAANAAATVALPLFAARGVAPDFLSVEMANAFLLGASALMLAGYLRYFSRPVPVALLAAATAATLGLVSVFHLVVDSFALRVSVVSLYHGLICLAIGALAARAPSGPRSRYPFRFTAVAGLLLGIGHLVRLTVYALQAHGHSGFLDLTLWNLAFLAFGTLALPLLTIGGVMIVYDDLVARAIDMANRDFLTNAWSRRAFFELAERERQRALRKSKPMSLVVFDVDHFKAINDRHGHDAGDRVLVEIVARVGAIIRSIDYCARLGGEEFAVLLPEAERREGLQIAERIRQAVMREQAQPGRVLHCTISAGVATLEHGEESLADLLRRADAALYAAKAMGRNTVVDAQAPRAASSLGAA